MREIKSELVDEDERKNVIVLKNIPHHQGLVKANRFLILFASSLMVIVFVLGFLLMPAGSILDDFKVSKKEKALAPYTIQNSVLSAEIKSLKGRFVGLISGSIESKLSKLEKSVKTGNVNTSLDAIQGLRNDVKFLQAYSVPAEKNNIEKQRNDEVLKEVSHLKSLIYLTLISCGLMVAAACGFWVRRRYQLNSPSSTYRAGLTKEK